MQRLAAAAAAKRCTDPEQFLHDMIHHLQTSTQGRLPLTTGEIAERQYHEGKITHIRQDDPQRRRFAGGKLVSEMVIEDREPY